MTYNNFTNRFKMNRLLASKIKINPDTFFSSNMSQYCHEIAKYWQLHDDAIPIVLINIVATTCEQSYVYRANQFKKPMNLYNCIIAKSSYGKSSMLGLVQTCILAVRNCRPTKFREFDDINNGSDHIRVIFNEGTTAGVLDSLKGCTRLLMTEEGDVILKRMGAFLMPVVVGRDSLMLDDCRAQLINLYDHPENYSKKLKNSLVEVKNSKLNILAALTGEIIERVIMRRAQNTLADALYERFLFWVLAGEIIETDVSRPSWNSRWPTIEQFSVMMSYFEGIEMHFDEDSNIRMIQWCNFIKKEGSKEEGDDHLASRLGKTVDAVHRLAGLFQVIENSSVMMIKFVQMYGTFENESISPEFLSKIEAIFIELYGLCIQSNRRFFISMDVVERAIDVVAGNIEQYKLLMFIPVSEQANGLVNFKKPVDSVMLQIMTKKDKKRAKFGQKSSEMEQAVLLFDSVLFTLRTLYDCRLLKNGAAVLRDVCESLVVRHLLIKVDRGTGFRTKSVTIYIKSLPNPTSDIECYSFIKNIASFDNPLITMEAIISSSKKIKYCCKNAPVQYVFDILNRPQYKHLNLDLSPLYRGDVDKRCIEAVTSVMNINGEYFRNLNEDTRWQDQTLNNRLNSNMIELNDDSTVSIIQNDKKDNDASESTLIAPEQIVVGEIINIDSNDGLEQTVLLLNDNNGNTCHEHQNGLLAMPPIDLNKLSMSCITDHHKTIQMDECSNLCDTGQNFSSNTECIQQRKQQGRSELKRLQVPKQDNAVYRYAKRTQSRMAVNSTDDNCEQEVNQFTSIAERLCRTRLPRARF